MRQRDLTRHEFVSSIPEHLAEGVLYVSVSFATAIHSCCCGCGNEVVTPLSPSDWEMSYDGESISLNPSIGNRRFACGSHYFIRRNRVMWLPSFREAESRPRQSLWRRFVSGLTLVRWNRR